MAMLDIKAQKTIQCQSIGVTFNNSIQAVKAVDIGFNESEIVSLIGPSGCGKTTLLRVLAGLQKPTTGTLAIDPSLESKRGNIAFVFQQPNLLPWRTALQNVMLPLALMGIHGSNAKEMASDVLHQVRLEHAMQRFPRELSGGMKMRVSLARALVTDPIVMLLDEPFAALDDILRQDLGDLLMQIWEARKFTAVLETHNIAEAALLSHRIAVMNDGSVTQTINNPLSFPKSANMRRTADFADFYGTVSDALRGQHG